MLKIIYTNSKGESVALGQTAPFFVTLLEGFSNVTNIINTIKSPNQDGATETNTTLDARHLVIGGEFLYGNRQDGRNKLIEVFNPKLDGVLKYINGGIKKEIRCRPESSPIIASTNLSTVPYTINLYASNPYWQDVNKKKTEIATWQGAFEFPLEIPIETGIEMGYREPSLIVNVINNGTVPTGMKIEFRATATVVNPSILNIDTREFFKLDYTMQAQEKIVVNTIFQQKRVESILNGVTTNIFNCIDLDSTFLQLGTLDNLLRYDAEEGSENLEVDIYHTSNYVGV